MLNIITSISEMRKIVGKWKEKSQTIGLVPTMGYLHEGHESLIKQSVSYNDRTVLSIFVNPTQFAPNEDLDSYPRDLDHDLSVAEAAGADIVFHPSPEEMYDADRATSVHVSGLGDELCGKSRPIHFDGVCLIVSKLFNIVSPDRAYFGKKDAQQLVIVKRMARDLSFGVEVVGCPIVREADGLAKSSRNTYLSPEERQAATVLSRALGKGKAVLDDGERSSEAVVGAIQAELAGEPLADPDYVQVVDASTLQPVGEVDRPALVALAVRIGKTRLIDNFFYPDDEA